MSGGKQSIQPLAIVISLDLLCIRITYSCNIICREAAPPFYIWEYSQSAVCHDTL